MAVATGVIVERAMAEITKLDAAARARIAARPATRAEHARQLTACAGLHEIEFRPPPRPRREAPAAARVVFWNAERLKHPAPSAALLGRLDAAALLLCELDLGMARSGQRHTCRELAQALGMGYAFGVEFLELGLGDARERARHAGARNRHGLHGGAILSPCPLERPRLVRLDVSGAWFDGGFGERRVGGRMAVVATLRLAGGPVTLASVHLESHGDPDSRALEMRTLVDAIEAYAPGRAALLGGDFNTSSSGGDAIRDRMREAALRAAAPDRYTNPVPHEPLFEVAAAAGYDWQSCNAAGVTARTRPDETPPPPPLAHLDWFFARGLVTTDPGIVPAIDDAGVAISDHDALVVTIGHRR